MLLYPPLKGFSQDYLDHVYVRDQAILSFQALQGDSSHKGFHMWIYM